jgi:hypothetical protein
MAVKYGPRIVRGGIKSIYERYKKRQVAKKPKAPNVAIGPYLGPIPKLTSAKMPKTGVNRFHFEDFGTNASGSFAFGNPKKQGGCAHIGFTDTGGMVVYMAAAGAILRSALTRAGMDSPSTWGGNYSDTVGGFHIHLRRNNAGGGDVDSDNHYYVCGTSGRQLANTTKWLAERMLFGAQYNRTLAYLSVTDHEGKVLFQSEHIGESMLDIRIKTNVKFQNVTPADSDPDSTGADMNRNAINSNPLSGVVCRFADPAPKLKDGVSAEITEEENQIEQTMVNEDDPSGSNGRLYTRAFYNQSGNAHTKYSAPFERPKALFMNCTHHRKVHLQPGGYRNLAFIFNYHGTVVRFMENIAANQRMESEDASYAYRRQPKLGCSYTISLEPAIRSVANEEVKLVWNRDIDAVSSFKFYRKPQLPVRNVVVSDGATFYQSF